MSDVPKVDENGYILLQTGDYIGDIYRYEKVLGEGSFGRVVLATKTNTNEKVAIKIFTKFETADREVSAVEYVASINENSLFVNMEEYFHFHGNYCITYELLGQSIYDFMNETAFHKFSIKEIRRITYQLSHAVNFLHINGMAHTDIKPENILFVNGSSTQIKLIDFGAATICTGTGTRNNLITSRPYRAPEVILKINWSLPCDIWSIGCILFEMYTLKTLFTASNDHQHLEMMEAVLGPMPYNMANSGHTHYFLNGKLTFIWKKTGQNSLGCLPLRNYQLENSEDDKNIFNLLANMLAYDPKMRITLKEVLDNPFYHNHCEV